MKTEVLNTFDYVAQDLYFKEVALELNASLAGRSARMLMTGMAGKETGGPSGDVIGDAVVAYDSALTPVQRQVAGDSLMFAEMRADYVCGKKRDNNEKWFGEYNRALVACGWYSQDLSFTDFKSKTTKLTVNRAILQILETIAGPNPTKILSLMSTALDAAKKDETGLKLIESKSKENKAGTFKGIPCTTEGGHLMVVMACLHLQSKNVLVNGFFGEFESENVKIYRAAGKRYINEDAFAKVRDRVRAYIYGVQDDYFRNL